MIWFVGVGGMLGSMLRYIFQLVLNRLYPSSFPWGTFSVNIIGCLIIGIVAGLISKGNIVSPEWRLFLASGFCGGFTTFSAFSLESVNLVQNGYYLHFSLYILASVALGLAATLGGFMFVKMV